MATLNNQVRALLQDEEFQGLTALVRMGSRAVPALTAILARTGDVLQQQRAAIALGRIGGEAAGAALVKSLKSREPVVVIAALNGLKSMKYNAATDAVRRVLTSKDESVRRHAAAALGVIGTRDDVSVLEQVIGKDESEMVRKGASDALRMVQRR